ncbi:MAG TPA: glycosyltransferase family 4 protein, partial [Acidimicrobiia bacterium]|nr:glycosyltransferase family 4 protein [Acidimicrobiia bacterium]
GHTARWKGHDVFVEAAALVAERHPAVRFAVVAGCTFPEHEGAFDAAVQRRVGELGLSSRLVWTDGVDDMSAAMASFDLLVHASRLPEPFGRVVVEAMAQGTPVIGTTLGAGPELVPPSAGRLVEPGDALALADAITALLDEPDKLAAMGEAAVAEARRFDISVAAGAFARIYADLVR